MTYMPWGQETVWDAENTFYMRSHPSRLAKLLAHYEIYKMIVDIPGDVLELGVYKGASLSRFATFRQILENDFSRTIYGLDTFGAFPKSNIEGSADLQFIEEFEDEGGEGISDDDLSSLIREKNIQNVHLIKGNVFDTIPDLKKEKPSLKISLLHLDMDVYEPTSFALRELIPNMVRGGIVLFDDYSTVEGATRAGDEIARELGVQFTKLSNYSVPSFFRIP